MLLPADRSLAQTSSETRVKEYIANVRHELDEAVGIAGGLKVRARWAIAVTVAAAFLSLTSGLMPQLKRRWSKTAALVLGFLAGTTTIVNNNFFGVDSGLLEDNAYELEREVSTMRDRLDTFGLLQANRPDYDEDLLTWHTDTVHQMSRFRDRREELRRPARRRAEPREVVASTQSFLPIVHAEAQFQQRALPPSWVSRTPPQDERFIYFVGKGTDPDSLADAKAASERDAYRQAELFLATRANSCPLPVLQDRAAKEAEVIGTHFGSGTVDSSNMRAYTYSTLLRLNKALADPSMLQAMTARALGEIVRIQPSRVAAPRQLGGNVGVFVGPAAANTLRILVFSTTNVAARWPASRSVRYEDLKRALPPAQILQDVTLAKCGQTTFRAGGAPYSLTLIEVSSGSDRSASLALAADRPASARN
jgi:hypothetical protein